MADEPRDDPEHAEDTTPREPGPEGGGQAGAEDEDAFTVLKVFGLKLEVSNPRLAELLTMDAQTALTTDVRDLGHAEDVREVRGEAEQGMPDVVIAPTTPHEEAESQRRVEMKADAAGIGERMGFTTHSDGLWESPTGVTLLTRTVGKKLSFAGATHFVSEIAEHRASLCGEDCTALFVVADQQTADVFKVAIRQRRLHHLMRTVSLDNLQDLAAMYGEGVLDHNQAVILLAPVADIDVGEVLSVIRSASGDVTSGTV